MRKIFFVGISLFMLFSFLNCKTSETANSQAKDAVSSDSSLKSYVCIDSSDYENLFCEQYSNGKLVRAVLGFEDASTRLFKQSEYKLEKKSNGHYLTYKDNSGKSETYRCRAYNDREQCQDLFASADHDSQPSTNTGSVSQTIKESDLPGEYFGNAQKASISKDNTGNFIIKFPFYDQVVKLSRKDDKMYVFTTGELDLGECDDPGCTILRRIYGIVYFKTTSGTTKLTVKATFDQENPHPESSDDPEGLTKTVEYLTKK